MKAYDNKTAFLKSVLKTVMAPPGGLKLIIFIICITENLECRCLCGCLYGIKDHFSE